MGEARPGETPTSATSPRQQGGGTATAAPRPCASQRPQEAFTPAPCQGWMVTGAMVRGSVAASSTSVRVAHFGGTTKKEPM